MALSRRLGFVAAGRDSTGNLVCKAEGKWIGDKNLGWPNKQQGISLYYRSKKASISKNIKINSHYFLRSDNLNFYI